jgi:hypothetical protein
MCMYIILVKVLASVRIFSAKFYAYVREKKRLVKESIIHFNASWMTLEVKKSIPTFRASILRVLYLRLSTIGGEF